MEKSNFLLSAKSMLSKIALFAMIASLSPSTAFAGTNDTQAVQQNEIVKGTVVDEAGEPIIGATVKIAGTGIGVATDVDGNFSLAAKSGSKLEISAIGYKTVQLEAQAVNNVVMEEDQLLLDEVVALGFGIETRKQDLSGAVATLPNPEKLKTRSTNSSTGMLQGQMAGVRVQQNNGDPGGSFSMQIRGQGSPSGDPILWVVDGIIGGPIPSAEEIETLTVLKDAASAAVYGAAGATGGVIVVTTKHGKKTEGVQLDYEGQFGLANATGVIHGLNAADYVSMRAQDDPNGWILPDHLKSYVTTTRTDWADAIFRTATKERHNVGVSFGNDWGRHRLTFNYHNDQGTLKNTWNKGININYKGDFDINQWFRVSENFNWSRSRGRGAGTSGVTDGVIINSIYDPSHAPMYEEDGRFSSWLPEEYKDYLGLFGDSYNALALLERGDGWNNPQSFSNHISATIHDIVPGLKFTTRFSYWQSNNFWKNFTGYRYELTGRQESSTSNNMNAGGETSSSWKTENTLTYDNTFGKHTIGLMVSTTADKDNGYRSASVTGSGYADESVPYRYLAFATSKSQSDGWGGRDSNVALVTRASYSYADRYFITASWRRDWAGRLVYEYNHHDFPAVTAAWKVSSEKFWEPLKDKVQLFKIRGSWGRVGNRNSIGYHYSAVNLATAQRTDERAQYGLNTDPTAATEMVGTYVYNNRAFNPTLTWETSEQYGVGVDLGLLNNRLGITLDVYKKRTFDLIQTQTTNFPDYIGLESKPQVNLGEVENKGAELTVTWNDKIGKDFSYYLNGNVAWNENKVTDTGNIDDEGNYVDWAHGGSFRNLNNWSYTTVGGPLYQFKLVHCYGLITNEADLAKAQVAQPGAQIGDLWFQDYNEDGKISELDKQFCGSATPKWSYSVSGGANYKNFGFDFQLYGVGGAQNLYVAKTMIFNDNEGNFNRAEGIKDAWGWEGRQSGTLPRLSRSDENGNFSTTSDWFLESGSFLRLKAVTLSYDFTDLLRKCTHFADRGSRLMAYITGENLFTITPYSGMDPECNGYDTLTYPVSRTISFGVKVTY